MQEYVGDKLNENGAEQQKEKSELWEWIKALLIALILVLLIRTFIFTPTIVSGPSMLPNFHDGERLIVNKFIYYIKEPSRGEVIVFHAPEEKDYIKRVIALPGDTIRVIGDRVYVNGEVIDEPYLQEVLKAAEESGRPYNHFNYKMSENGIEEVIVPENSLFVMGDNRSQSKDSRMESVGFVPMDEVVGRVDIVFWPLKNVRIVNHGKE